MFQDKNPWKYVALGFLLAAVLIGLLLFFGMQAQAATRFLPIEEITTPKGIKVWVVKDNSLPVISLKFLFVDSGSANDPENLQGLARLLSNTLDEGAGELDSQNFQKALADHSITLTFSAGRDSFGGDVKTLSRHQDKAFELLTLALNKPRFDPEPVARMKDGNLTRIKSSMSEPDWMAARLINDRAFGTHIYAKNSGGTLSSLPRITPEDLRTFKNTYLTRDRLLIAAAGDINTQTFGATIDKAFGDLPAKGPEVTTKDFTLANQAKTFLYDQDIPQTFIEIMIPSFDNKDKDFFALKVLNYIFGGAGFGSRLMDTVREKGGLTYGIYSNLQDYRYGDVLGISTSTKNESAKEMLSLIQTEMTNLQNTEVSAKELQDAKSYLTGSMPLALTSTDDIAEMILSLQFQGLPQDYLDHYKDYINAVTPADIQRVAKRVLNPSTMVTALVGKPQTIENAESVKELPNVQ